MSVRYPIYMDYHATTPPDPRVVDKVAKCMLEVYGNASSNHHVFGDQAEDLIERARGQVADLACCAPTEIVFTSGATEAANHAIRGLAKVWRATGKRIRIGLSRVEHKAVLETCSQLESEGDAELLHIPLDPYGRPEMEGAETLLRQGLDLVCVLHANNEIGTITNVAEFTALAHRYNTLVFVDATQSLGKIDVRFQDWDLDLLACSAHKLYGPKGVGALLVRSGIRLPAMVTGGGQEGGRRAGTLNTPGIVGFGHACALRAAERHTDEARIAVQRDRLQAHLASAIPNLTINGDPIHRLAGNLHISLDVPGGAVVARLRRQLAVSTGSACTAGLEGPSHVVQALGLSAEQVEGALRVGLGKFTSDEEVCAAGELLITARNAVKMEMAVRCS